MNDFLTVATIVKPQGIRGEVKVITLTDTPADLKAFTRIYVGGNEHKLLKVRPQAGNCAFLTISGIADRNAAELLRGKEITVLRGDAPALPDGTYYIADLIGCDVVTDAGEAVGKVVGVTPARTDIYEVQKSDGKSLSFPAVGGLILDVNTVERLITVNAARLAEVALDE